MIDSGISDLPADSFVVAVVPVDGVGVRPVVQRDEVADRLRRGGGGQRRRRRRRRVGGAGLVPSARGRGASTEHGLGERRSGLVLVSNLPIP